MKQVIGIWCVALTVAILGVLYVNWCIDAAMSGFERTTTVDASSYLGSMYYDPTTGAVQEYVNGAWASIEPATIPTLQVSDSVIVGVESYQGFEDNTGYRVQPAQVRSLDYRVPTIIQQ